MLKGRLGLETARVPQADRHGLIYFERGRLTAADGTLCFTAAEGPHMPAGEYAVPFQMVSCILLGPGSTVSHDALRLLARHGTGLVCVDEDGVRMYASMPFGPDTSGIARRQALVWADPTKRTLAARRMYAWRLGEVLPDADIAVLRGIEGARAKESYRRIAEQFGVTWAGRRYDRGRPEAADLPNQAINHAATAAEAAAMIAVSAVGALPQLGFVHEDSGISFVLDIADLFRDTVTLPIAFATAKEIGKRGDQPIERVARRLAGKALRRDQVIPAMIDRVKELFGADDGGRNA